MIHPSGIDRSAARTPPESAASGHATWSLMIRTGRRVRADAEERDLPERQAPCSEMMFHA
jgi:hypothetical protein